MKVGKRITLDLEAALTALLATSPPTRGQDDDADTEKTKQKGKGAKGKAKSAPRPTHRRSQGGT